RGSHDVRHDLDPQAGDAPLRTRAARGCPREGRRPHQRPRIALGDPMTKLYYGPGACSLASHIALEEAGIPYETERLILANGDQRKPEYLKINPRGRVPTLVVDDKVLTENMAILTYVGGGYPQAGLWPRTTWDQATAVSHLAWFADTVHPAYGHIFRPERYVDGEDHQQAVKAKGRTVFEGYL